MMQKEKYMGLTIGFIIAQLFMAPILGLGVEQTGERIFFICMGVFGCYLADRWEIILPKLVKLTKLRLVVKEDEEEEESSEEEECTRSRGGRLG